MKNLFLFAAILFSVIFSSCSKNDGNTVITHQYNAAIQVTVSQIFFDNGSYTDSVVAGAKVDVYANKEDRENVLSPDYSKTTGSNGKVEFDNLDKTYYYLRVTNPHTQKVIKDETKTPDGTTALMQIIFQ